MSFVLRSLRLLSRKPKALVRGPRWLVKKAVAELLFEQQKTTEVELVSCLTRAGKDDVLRCWDEGREVPWPLLYAIARLSRPATVVETGVASGRSSFSILQALADNGEGLLYSIELGGAKKFDSSGLTFYAPPDEEVGSLVPRGLRDRWRLILGDAREELPLLLSQLGPIDVFLHDSLHTEEHMLFEYQTAWPNLREGGYLLSDDITFSFREFAVKAHRPYTCTGNIPRFGAIRK